jgi:ribosomal protein S27AE
MDEQVGRIRSAPSLWDEQQLRLKCPECQMRMITIAGHDERLECLRCGHVDRIIIRIHQ